MSKNTFCQGYKAGGVFSITILRPAEWGRENAENLPVRTEPDIQAISKQITQEEIQRDFDYYMAQRIAEKLKSEGLITVDEFNKLTALNRSTFLPMNVEILPKIR